MVSLTVDGKKVKAEKRTPLIKIAEKMGIDIPTLCYHPALEPYGACRLCLVEIEKKGRKKLVTACNYPAEDGLIVNTRSGRVIKARKLIIELLLSRCSGVEELKKLAEEYGCETEKPRFGAGREDCILCGLCVRVCSEIVGRSAISFSKRGIEKEVAPPFQISSEACIGCGACAYVCPTGCIKIEDVEGFRNMEKWKARLPIAKCSRCGAPIAPQAQLDCIKEKLNLPEDIFTTCQKCKRMAYSKKIIALGR